MQLTGIEAVFFYALAFMTIFFSVFTITARNAVHSALFLMSTLLSAAGLFLLLQAEFVAGVQILVYVGGVLVLFLFVVMLVNVRDENARLYTRQYYAGVLISVTLAIAFMVVLVQTQNAHYFVTTSRETPENAGEVAVPLTAPASQNTQAIGQELYTRTALQFEIASVILLVAIIGAVRLARERKQEQLYD